MHDARIENWKGAPQAEEYAFGPLNLSLLQVNLLNGTDFETMISRIVSTGGAGSGCPGTTGSCRAQVEMRTAMPCTATRPSQAPWMPPHGIEPCQSDWVSEQRTDVPQQHRLDHNP